MIRVGTSGYGYHAWSPKFYPSGLCYAGFLKHYASRFSCCELTHTFESSPFLVSHSGMVETPRL